jgi:glutamyl-tRNA reductase
MPVFVLGLNHRTAPLELLERLSIPPDQRPKALGHLLAQDHVEEALILSTCNRVEIYASISRFHGGAAEVRRALADLHHLDQQDFAGYLYDYLDERAVGHLFNVTAGLDSLVLGESQILTQVREAFAEARTEEALGPTLSTLFQRAIRAGRRARAETGLGAQLASTVSVGLDLAEHRLGQLAGRRALVVGAGKMGRLAAKTLKARGVRDLAIANRTLEHGERLAHDLGARALPLSEITDELARADIVLASTAATTPTVTVATVEAGLARRRELPGTSGAPLFVVDLGVPRDVEPDVRYLPGTALVDLDGLRALIETGGGEQAGEVDRARALVAGEAASFLSWQREARLGPTIRALRSRAERIRQQELARAAARLADLTEREAAAVEAVTRGLVNKLLHDPVVRGKALATGPDGDLYARMLRELYAIDDEAGGTPTHRSSEEQA